jgi:hypothetical protein
MCVASIVEIILQRESEQATIAHRPSHIVPRSSLFAPYHDSTFRLHPSPGVSGRISHDLQPRSFRHRLVRRPPHATRKHVATSPPYSSNQHRFGAWRGDAQQRAHSRNISALTQFLLNVIKSPRDPRRCEFGLIGRQMLLPTPRSSLLGAPRRIPLGQVSVCARDHMVSISIIAKAPAACPFLSQSRHGLRLLRLA